jgi:hypothetical protein
LISSLDSSAAFLPVAGSAQAQRPPVTIFPRFNFSFANDLNNA